jgi:hypothetical protein
MTGADSVVDSVSLQSFLSLEANEKYSLSFLLLSVQPTAQSAQQSAKLSTFVIPELKG